MASRYLIISDTQIPFENPDALDFCRRVQKDFRIPKENIIHIGDELDNYYLSRFPRDPDAEFSPKGEIKLARERLKPWIAAFPAMHVCISNHGLRLLARAFDSYMPSELIRAYHEVSDLPTSWIYRDEWIFKEKYPFRCVHGIGYSGISGARNAAVDGRISTCIGHLHAHGGISYIRNDKNLIWGMNVGCLIDESSFGFRYAKHARFKAMLSVGVVIDDGKTPILVPL